MRRTLAGIVLVACVVALRPAHAGAPAARPVRHGPGRSSAPAATVAVPAHAAIRTLADIRIEGEIPVPQVLFVTARKPWRLLEFQHRRYFRSGAQLGQATELPGWIVVTHDPVTAGKEIAR